MAQHVYRPNRVCNGVCRHRPQLLWRLSEPASVRGFKTLFQLNHSNARRHPLLAAFLRVCSPSEPTEYGNLAIAIHWIVIRPCQPQQEEHRLSLIRHLPHVLSWHALLFELLGQSGITRDEVRVYDGVGADMTTRAMDLWQGLVMNIRGAWFDLPHRRTSSPTCSSLSVCQRRAGRTQPHSWYVSPARSHHMKPRLERTA
jgi:hypothetical protein